MTVNAYMKAKIHKGLVCMENSCSTCFSPYHFFACLVQSCSRVHCVKYSGPRASNVSERQPEMHAVSMRRMCMHSLLYCSMKHLLCFAAGQSPYFRSGAVLGRAMSTLHTLCTLFLLFLKLQVSHMRLDCWHSSVAGEHAARPGIDTSCHSDCGPVVCGQLCSVLLKESCRP